MGQTKVEREFRISKDKVPEPALSWIDAAFPEIKVKWFYEETSGKKSYEAKLKWDDHKISTEFDTLGLLEDVEIVVSFQELDKITQSHLLESLHNEDQNFKLRKIQRQLSGNPDEIIRYIQGNIDVNVITRYEIEFYSTSSDKYNLWEGLFSSDGQLISKRKVQLLSTDNLDF